jgi:hypothetical protein
MTPIKIITVFFIASVSVANNSPPEKKTVKEKQELKDIKQAPNVSPNFVM